LYVFSVAILAQTHNLSADGRSQRRDSEAVLNEKSNFIWSWRTALLTKPLNPEKDETVNGQEYQRTLNDRGEAEKYLQAYVALVADRSEATVSERTLLAARDARAEISPRQR